MSTDTRSASVGPSLVLLALICQEVGASVAVQLFPAAGPVGMVALRLCFSAVVLLAVTRPSLRGRTRHAWQSVVAFGFVLAAMNTFFYLALERLHLGTAVTIEVLGPLVLSVLAGRRWLSLLWAGIAAAGVALLGGGATELDPLGVLFALLAAVMWAAYILLSRSSGTHFDGVSGLAIALAIGALLTTPVAAFTAGPRLLDPAVLAVGLGVALLSTAIPYALEQTALRRITTETFAVLLSLAPAVAALAGFIVLHQALTAIQLVGIACVVIAGIGAVRTARRNSDPSVVVATIS